MLKVVCISHRAKRTLTPPPSCTPDPLLPTSHCEKGDEEEEEEEEEKEEKEEEDDEDDEDDETRAKWSTRYVIPQS